MSSLSFAVKNLRRNRLRSAVTVLGVASLLGLVSLLSAIVAGLQGSSGSQTNPLRLITRNNVSLTFPLPESYEAKIRVVPHVAAVTPASWFGGTYIDERHFFARFMTDPETLLSVQKEYVVPPEQVAAWQKDRQGALVSRKLADRYGFKLGDRIVIRGDIYPVNVELNVRAIYGGGVDEALYFHRMYVEEAMGRPGVVGTYRILVDSPDALGEVTRRIDAAFENSDAETKTETEAAFRAGFVSMYGNVQGLMTNLTLIISVTILLTAGNTMAMAIRERTREMAVLKALGFPPRRILGLVVLESTALAALASLIGVGGFWGVSYWIFVVKRFRPPMIWFPITLTPAYGISLLLGAVLLGVIAGVVPGVVAARASVTDGLRTS